jgi:hypothetical protein
MPLCVSLIHTRTPNTQTCKNWKGMMAECWRVPLQGVEGTSGAPLPAGHCVGYPGGLTTWVPLSRYYVELGQSKFGDNGPLRRSLLGLSIQSVT